MKIRQGYVSNSSTSSFLVAIKENTEVCPTKKLIDFIHRNTKDRDKIYEEKDRNNLTKELKNKIKESNILIKEYDNILKIFEKIKDNEEFVELFRKLDYYINYARYTKYKEYIIDNDIVNLKINNFKNKINNETLKIKKYTEDLELINSVKEDYYFITFEDDISYPFLEPLIKDMIDENLAIILKKETT